MLTGVSYLDASQFSVGQHLAQLWVELRESSEGRRPTAGIIEDLRTRLASPPPGILTVDIDQPQAGPTGKAIDVSIRGPELEVLEEDEESAALGPGALAPKSALPTRRDIVAIASATAAASASAFAASRAAISAM